MAKARRWCRDCKAHVLAENDEPNFSWWAGQGCLILVTLGLWLPVALIWGVIRQKTYRCPQCGRRC